MSAENELNPFVHRLEIPFPRKLQVFFMSVTIAPLRFVFGLALFMIAWLLGLLFTAGSPEELTEPLSDFRTFLYNVLQASGRAIWKILGFSFVVKGKRAPSKEAPIAILAPHTSPFDIALWFACAPLPAAFSKRENFKLPLFGTLVRAVQPVLVVRDDETSRQSALGQIQHRVSHASRWPQLNVFPEGTSTNGQCLIMFKVGAFLSGTPVQPVTIRYTNNWNTYTNTESSAGYFKVLWLTLCQFWSVIEVDYLPVYVPSRQEKADAKFFARNVRALMAEKLGLPCTEHTFRDRLLMKLAGKLGFPKQFISTEFHKFSVKYGVSFDQARSWLADFAAMSKRNSRRQGHVALREFAGFLGLPPTLAVRDLFEVHDSTMRGFVSFNQYVAGMALLCSTATAENTLEISSEIFNQYLGGGGSAPSVICVGETKELYFDMAVVAREIEKRRRCAGGVLLPVKQFFARRPEYAMLCLWYQLMLKKGADGAAHVNSSASLSSELRRRKGGA